MYPPKSQVGMHGPRPRPALRAVGNLPAMPRSQEVGARRLGGGSVYRPGSPRSLVESSDIVWRLLVP